MATNFSKTKLAAAVSAAAIASPAGAVVIVGGNDGWEVSFDGNVNAFYTIGDYDAGYIGNTVDTDSARVTSGFLPAFFSFNVKTPTVGSLTGSARISFAPVIHTGGTKTQFNLQQNSQSVAGLDGISGAQIDTREVLANISGPFGEVSFGRTLSLFGRNAILLDMTLFGVGFAPGPGHFGSVTFGRVGHGYTYPDFAARIQYTTPNINGFQLAVGMYDPSTFDLRGGNAPFSVSGSVFAAGGGILDETDIPRFEGEFSYARSWDSGNMKLWADGLWQTVDSTCSAVVGCNDVDVRALGAGAQVGIGAWEVVGYYHSNDGLGLTAQFNSLGVGLDAAGNLAEREGDGYYVQGTYTFNGKTKVGVSYGEGNVDTLGTGDTIAADLERSLWTVGVYHDVTSWLRVIAEYNRGENHGGAPGGGDAEADTFSVGSFIFW
ncbi:MAG: porin [Pseudomonadota bacterium]